ncbi:MAG: hypothetical protein ACO1OQ_11655 [Rufibacter sp.]
MNFPVPSVLGICRIWPVVLFCWIGFLSSAQGQDKVTHQFSWPTSIDSTQMVVTTIEEQTKWSKGLSDKVGLLFINTSTGQAFKLKLPEGYALTNTNFKMNGHYHGERLVVLSSKSLKGGKKEWDAPHVLFICTASGKHLKQVSSDTEHVTYFTLNPETNTIVFVTKHDANGDQKFDLKDEGKVYLYHIGTGQLTTVAQSTEVVEK